MAKNSFTKKDKVIFLYGILIAIFGGFLTNIAVTTMFRFVDKDIL